MRIAVMGAGGVGGYVGGRLAEAGQQVHLVARGSHLAALQHGGLRIESPHGDASLPDIHATGNPTEVGPVDVVLFAVKLADTDAAAAAMTPMIDDHTRVVTLQNGIDSARMIAAHVPRSQIAEGIIYIAAYIKQPGVIVNLGGLHRAVIDRMGGDAMMARFFDASSRAVGLEVEPTDDARTAVWRKFIALAALSGVTCISRLPIGAVYAHPDTLAFARQLLQESIAVANASGQQFEAGEVDAVIELFSRQPYDQKSSMLLDLEQGKPLELPWLSGRIHQLGRELDIPTPAHSAVWAALCAYVDGPPERDR